MTALPAVPSRIHIPSLDGVRGIAIVLVLAHQLNRIAATDGTSRLASHALDFGWVGVQLFFVLSGFLITGILLDTRESPGYLRAFFARRVLRIFPLYFAALLLFFGVLPALGVVPPGWREHEIWYWLYLSNWTQHHLGGALPHFWSLAIEEQFYLLWPFVVLGFGPRGLLKLCLAIAAASLASRGVLIAAGVAPEAIYMFSTSRMDALALGGAAAALLRLPWSASAAPERLWVVAAVSAVAGFGATRGFPQMSPIGQTIGYSTLAFVFAAAILALALEHRDGGRAGITRALSKAPMRALGAYSYGMYVFHKPLHDLVGKPVLEAMGLGSSLSLGAGLAYVGVGTVVTFGVGMLSFWLLERHFLALRHRFAPENKPAGSINQAKTVT
jgi:peptidoglycan/LPS O-acetylase OafA/YrhL